ncbi:hypothetical protein [Candidatus Regiella endosymbiont of Tuberolachnus salignus]|uniref:hypothetical protein n=1 Tax=Candidatus Regiella endosymbiont of Tuberolachnus salignus TaxID=3077956 RepID=UPI0030D47B5A
MKLPLGGQGVRPMSVDILRDSASTRSQQRGGFKGERYNKVYNGMKTGKTLNLLK